MNSILSSNFQRYYLKIGHPFGPLGWPETYKSNPEQLLTLSQIRLRMQESDSSSYLLGGHNFLGLESFIPGPSDIWMNYREPIARLNSGIKRFFVRTYRTNETTSNHLIKNTTGSGPTVDFDSPDSIDNLLRTKLARESNGMARRLSAFSLSSKFNIDDLTNVETIDILDESYDKKQLLDASIQNLRRVKIIINSQWLQASLLCIEKTYNLTSPLINPFSDLRHNPVTLAGISRSNTRLLDNCKSVLHSHSDIDRQLFPYMNKIFAEQVNRSSIDSRLIAIRDAIHSRALLKPKWFVCEDQKDVLNLVHNIGDSFAKVCMDNSELSQDIFDTLMGWDPLPDELKENVAKYCYEKYSMCSRHL